MLKRLLGAGFQGLAQNVELINELNVFPVPDGDTGINLFHTLQRAWQEIAETEDSSAGEVAQRFAYGALMGARGNSGTILSQLLTGFADGLEAAETVTAPQMARAFRAAAARAYAAVSQPVEGTLLTVAREAADSLKEGDTLEGMFHSLLAAAQVSLEDTPNRLPILKEAGVVDAGGMGLVCFLQGIHAHNCGAPLDLGLPALQAGKNAQPPTSSLEAYGYDVQFLMLGAALDVRAVRADLEKLGWSVIVVGDEHMIKVHIHADNPALPLDYAVKTGAALDDIVVENMQLQVDALGRHPVPAAVPAPGSVAVIAVVDGAGMRGVFRGLNCARIIEGGAGQNPATQDFIAAIEAVDANDIIILPNNRNIELAAQQAADMVDGRRVTVVATRSMLEGVSAMIAFGDAGDSHIADDALVEAMRGAALATTSIEITCATRSTQLQGLAIREGDYLAIIDGRIGAAAADVSTALLDALRQAGANEQELATLYYGDDMTRAAVNATVRGLSLELPSLEFEAVYGGQSLYSLLVSVE